MKEKTWTKNALGFERKRLDKKAPRFEGKGWFKPDVGFAARFALSPVGG